MSVDSKLQNMETTKINSIQIPSVLEDPALSLATKAFLSALNRASGPPLESLSPVEARKILVSAQASAEVDLSVAVTTITYAGAIHDFGLLNVLADTQQSKALFRHAAAELNSYLF